MAVSTIGTATGRDYSTVSAWEADTDNDLSGLGVVEGRVMESVSETGAVVFSGSTNTSASDYRLLRADPGNGWNEGGSVAVSDSTSGIKCSSTGSWGTAFDVSETFFKVQNLIFDVTASNRKPFELGSADTLIENCIVMGATTSSAIMTLDNASAAAHNCYFVGAVTSAGTVAVCNGGSYVNCLAVSTGASGVADVDEAYGTNNAHNVAADGSWTGGAWNSADYNAGNDTSAPGANSVDNVTFSNAVENTSTDWRPKASGDYDGAGLVQAGYTTDVFGVARASAGNACTIGPVEVAAAASITPQAMYHYSKNTGSGL